MLIALVISMQATAGEHLKSVPIRYDYPVPHGEHIFIVDVPFLDGIDGWLSIHADMITRDKAVHARIGLINEMDRMPYWYDIINPGSSKNHVFPTMIHEFHPLQLIIKCINESYVYKPCIGYVVLYGK